MAKRTALYRQFSATNELLYVGIATNLKNRLRTHKNYSEWWDQVTDTKVEYFDTRQLALDAELIAIRTESPKFNTARKQDRKPPKPKKGFVKPEKYKRGGARPGAGRKAAEPTVQVRVPISIVNTVREMAECYKAGGDWKSVCLISETTQ